MIKSLKIVSKTNMQSSIVWNIANLRKCQLENLSEFKNLKLKNR